MIFHIVIHALKNLWLHNVPQAGYTPWVLVNATVFSVPLMKVLLCENFPHVFCILSLAKSFLYPLYLHVYVWCAYIYAFWHVTSLTCMYVQV